MVESDLRDQVVGPAVPADTDVPSGRHSRPYVSDGFRVGEQTR